MRLSRVLVFSLLVVALASSAVSAQSGEYLVDGRVLGSPEPNGILLQIEFDDHPWGGVLWTTAPAGVDVYRRGIGDDCGQWVRITDEPVPWNWVPNPGGTTMSFQLVDAGAAAGKGYLYLSRAVDANRDPIPEDGDVYLGVATNGVAFLAHASLDLSPGACGLSGVPSVVNCENNWSDFPQNLCYPPLLFATTPEISSYINTGTPLLLYGTIDSIVSPCGANETVAAFSLAIPTSSCVVSLETQTWGSVKMLYR